MQERKRYYDVIGDVHGHARYLALLLEKLGYRNDSGYYRHPERKAIFLGDLINRGPANIRTLEIVKSMADNDQALCIMGNHEFDALCYFSHSKYYHQKNRPEDPDLNQLSYEIQQVGIGKWETYLEWFRKLPFFLELDGFRAVHACWSEKSIEWLRKNEIRDHLGRITDDWLRQASENETPFAGVVEDLLRGERVSLPPHHPGLPDKGGNLRKGFRLKWWLPRKQLIRSETYDQVVRSTDGILTMLKDIKIPASLREEWELNSMGSTEIPVFFGHYCMDGTPYPLTQCAACLDYSVFNKGPLVCCRWNGESNLNDSQFVLINL